MTQTIDGQSIAEESAAGMLPLLARAASPWERAHASWLRPCGVPAVARERWDRWSRSVADGRPERVSEILAELGLSRDQWLTGLADVTVVPGERLPRWAQDAIDLLDRVGTEPDPLPTPRLVEVAGDGLPGWVDGQQPWRLHAGFRDWMTAAHREVDRRAADGPISAEARHDLVLDLARRQLFVSGPLLMETANARPRTNPLFGSDPRADWEALWSAHPVVARLLAVAWRQWYETTAELCERVAADLPALCPGLDVIGIDLSTGDRHCGGRSVTRFRMSDGTSVFLKPRSDRLRAMLAAVLARVDAAGSPLGLRLPTIIERDGYVWSREIPSGDCAEEQAVAAYFRRTGALLRVLQALGATDLHHENFIATPDQPVLVDLETTIGPGPLRSALPQDRVTERLADSPGPTSMVTSVVAGAPGRGTADLGALAGPSETLTPYGVPTLIPGSRGPELRTGRIPIANGAALPTLAGERVSLRGHEEALIAGYADGQRRLESLVGQDLVPHFTREPQIRFVARPTRTYARLLTQSMAPRALTDGIERELVLARLYRATGTAPAGLIGCEVDAMRDLDVPLFTVSFTGTDLVSDRGLVLRNAFCESATTRTRRRLDSVGSRTDYVDDLRATLFAMEPGDRPHAPSTATSGTVAPHHSKDPTALLLDRAIVSDTAASGGRALAWIGLEHDPNRNRWSYGRMSAGLTGQAGIGLVLATIAAHTMNPPQGCADAARAALLGSIDRVGSGADGPTDAFTGPAGVLYAAATAGRLLNDPLLDEAARSLLQPCLRAARRAEPSIVIGGRAGAILALLRLAQDGAVIDALTELAAQAERSDNTDAPDRWSASLPSRACGAALAAHRLAYAHPGLGDDQATPTPIGAGNAVATATVRPPAPPDSPLPAEITLRSMLDAVALGEAALRFGTDAGWVAQRARAAELLVQRQARTGRWCHPLPIADASMLSPVHGLPAIALLLNGHRPGASIARTLG